MRNRNRWLPLFAAALLILGFTACAENDIDDGDSANVQLEVSAITAPSPVATNGSLAAGTCDFVSPPAFTITVKNVPKNSLATTSPFNDVQITRVVINYTWADPAIPPIPPLEIPGGPVIPVDNTASLNIAPVNAGALNPAPTYAGQTAAMLIVVEGTTIDGDPVLATAGSTLTLLACNP